MLSTAFKEISYHRGRTRGTPRRSCYRMSVMGGTLMRSRESALEQVELLRVAVKSGAVDPATAAKVRSVLAREIETFELASSLEGGDRAAEGRFCDSVRKKSIEPGDAASAAADIIVRMEGGPASDQSVGDRLSAMKNRAEAVFKHGPRGKDWFHPGIHPDMITVLEKVGFVAREPRPTCYSPVRSPTGPSPARGAELRDLQKKLLNRNVKAGVLPVEVAEKVAAAQTRGGLDTASEKDLKDYQFDVRRAVRLLYSRGELTARFVKRMERAIDLDIIAFDRDKALVNDVAFHLRPALTSPIGEQAEKILVKHGYIPKSRNHRFRLEWFQGKPALSGEEGDKLVMFEQLIESDGPFELPGDEGVILRSWELPRTRLELRKKLRRALRALVMAGIVDPGKLKLAADVVSIPITGRVE
jgi:hypothetical protein